MKIEDLWIGDKLRLIKSGRTGTFEGVDKNGKARVNVEGQIVLSNANNLQIVEEKVTPRKELTEIEPIKSWRSDRFNERSIDLHIDVLEPSIAHQIPQMILQKQKSSCKAFIERSIQSRHSEIIIIHGRGEGQLQIEVKMILNDYEEVDRTELLHNGGATKVTFQYSS